MVVPSLQGVTSQALRYISIQIQKEHKLLLLEAFAGFGAQQFITKQ
jgi:hypothetical protein